MLKNVLNIIDMVRKFPKPNKLLQYIAKDL